MEMVIMEMKVCTKCKSEHPKTTEYFNKMKSGVDGLQYWCRECSHKAQKSWHIDNRDQRLEYHKQYSKDNPSKARIRGFKRTYKVSEEFIQELMNRQKGCCEICGCSLVTPESLYSFSIDHDHSNNLVRGLLCKKCNSIIGLANDSVTTLRSAIDYLERYSG